MMLGDRFRLLIVKCLHQHAPVTRSEQHLTRVWIPEPFAGLRSLLAFHPRQRQYNCMTTALCRHLHQLLGSSQQSSRKIPPLLVRRILKALGNDRQAAGICAEYYMLGCLGNRIFSLSHCIKRSAGFSYYRKGQYFCRRF